MSLNRQAHNTNKTPIVLSPLTHVVDVIQYVYSCLKPAIFLCQGTHYRSTFRLPLFKPILDSCHGCTQTACLRSLRRPQRLGSRYPHSDASLPLGMNALKTSQCVVK